MRYYIDGYNMLFRQPTFKKLQIEREFLLSGLNRKISLLNLNVSIVFDAAFQAGGRTKSHFASLEILYSAEGETADEYIVDVISHASNPRSLVVVTNDRFLGAQVRHLLAKVESVESFMQQLNRSYQKKFNNPPKLKIEKNTLKPEDSVRNILHPVCTKKTFECDVDYYQRVFEAEFQLIEEKKKEKRAARSSEKVRKFKKVLNPFDEDPVYLKNEVTEMERWLKAFEYRKDEKD